MIARNLILRGPGGVLRRLCGRGFLPAARLGFKARPLREAHDSAPQRAHILFGQLHPVDHVAQVALHVRLLAGGAEEAVLLKLALEMVEEGHDHLARRGNRPVRRAEAGPVAMRGAKPFIPAKKHGLGEIERGVGRIDRKRDDRVRDRDLVAVHARALGPEKDARLAALGYQLDGSSMRR